MSQQIVRQRMFTEADIRAYSRRGNYHSDAGTAQRIGLPGLVAQGVQVAGPAYAALLEQWGAEFLAHGELDLRFVGMVLAGQDIEATVTIDDGHATIAVENTTTTRTAVVGSAQRVAS